MTIALFCCICWGILFLGDTIAYIGFKQKEMPTVRLILAEGLVFLLYLIQCFGK